ncbi:MAG: hypothetical protein PHX25_03335 [Candidatus Pacebacteria bacterium]|nr:hypothetical protein [Candidatus Paceibacterota bacterium]
MKLISILSAIIVVMPFLGFPGSWENFVTTILAVLIFLKSFYTYRVQKATSAEKNGTFKQNGTEETQKNLFFENKPKLSEITEEQD